jgi:hypothetical protein
MLTVHDDQCPAAQALFSAEQFDLLTDPSLPQNGSFPSEDEDENQGRFDEERERTLYVSGLSQEVDERLLYELFVQVFFVLFFQRKRKVFFRLDLLAKSLNLRTLGVQRSLHSRIVLLFPTRSTLSQASLSLGLL